MGPKRLRQSSERRHARGMLAALNARDHRVTCADALSKLLLGQTEGLATSDHDPGDPLVGSDPCELLAVRGASLRAAPARGPVSRADRRDARAGDSLLGYWLGLRHDVLPIDHYRASQNDVSIIAKRITLWSVVSRSAWWSPSRRVHSPLEVLPARLRDGDVRLRDRGRVLAQHVKQDDQVAGAPVENPIELRAVVAAQLTQLAAYLARVREWRRRRREWLIVQSIDLEVDRRLLALIEPGDEVADRLGPIRCAIVDGLRAGHAAVLLMCSVRSVRPARVYAQPAAATRKLRSITTWRCLTRLETRAQSRESTPTSM